MDPDGHWFIDNYNRVRLFHGVNSVDTSPPWYHSYLLDDTRLQQLQDWGMNVVRLGTMWSGIEPSENNFNQTYINILRVIIEVCLIWRPLFAVDIILLIKYLAFFGKILSLVEPKM